MTISKFLNNIRQRKARMKEPLIHRRKKEKEKAKSRVLRLKKKKDKLM